MGVGLAVVTIIVLLFAAYIFMYGAPQWITDLFSSSSSATTVEDDIKKRQDDADKNLADAANANSLDPTLLNTLIKKTCAYGTFPCMNDNYIVDSTGCCVVKPDKTVPKAELIADAVIPQLGIVTAQLVATHLIKSGLLKSGKALSEAGEAAGAKAGEEVGAKVGEEVIADAAVSLTEMATSAVGGMLTSLGTGLGTPLVVFQFASVLVDLFAPTQYAAYQSNESQINTRNIIAVAFEKAMLDNNLPYPMLIPVSSVFTSSIPSVTSFLTTEYMEDALSVLETENINVYTNVIVSSFGGAALSDSDSKIVSDTITKTINKDPTKRDGIIFKYLQTNLPDDRKDLIQLFPSQSSETVQGVSLSEKGVIYWNTINRDKWINNTDGSDPPLVAMWSNSYVKLNKNDQGTQSKPNVQEVKLTEYLPFFYPYSQLYNACEGKIISGTVVKNGKDQASVYPYQYDVTFNYNVGTCNMTKNWCTYMGKNFDPTGNTDCKNIPGNEAADLILGTTITNGITQLNNTLKDRYGRKAGTIPSTCKDTEDKDGALCYPKCQDNYKGIGPVCWETCPSGYRDDGVFCAKPGSYGRGGGHITKSGCEKSSQAKTSGGCDKYGLLYYPKCNAGFHNVGCCVCSPTCTDGMKDIGVSCTKKSYTRGAGNLKSCEAGLNYEAGLCYEACKPGYYGVAAACFPCTGLEVTQDQKDKCKVLAPTTNVAP